MFPLLQDVFDDPAPAVNSAAVENNVGGPDADCDYPAEKGQPIEWFFSTLGH